MIWIFMVGLLLVIVYALVLLKLRNGLNHLKRGNSPGQCSVTVVVAARNEENCIGRCLDALTSQDWPKDSLQILVVDDRSEDRTARIVRRYETRFPFVSLIRITSCPANLSPKKHALMTAIRHASGDIIATTDADCFPGREWLKRMMAHFEPKVGMVVGFTPYYNNRQSLLTEMLQLDYFSMACVSAASIGLGFPISACGGNLMYRRQVYDELGGFGASSRLASGDDDLFVERVREETDWRITYAADPACHVSTRPPESWSEFVNQRIRYASKGPHYARPVVGILLALFSMNTILAFGWLSFFLSLKLTALWLLSMGIKTVAEYFFLKHGSKRFGVRFKPATFLLSALLHPFYIVSAGFLGQFAEFEWKKQRHIPVKPVAPKKV